MNQAPLVSAYDLGVREGQAAFSMLMEASPNKNPVSMACWIENRHANGNGKPLYAHGVIRLQDDNPFKAAYIAGFDEMMTALGDELRTTAQPPTPNPQPAPASKPVVGIMASEEMLRRLAEDEATLLLLRLTEEWGKSGTLDRVLRDRCDGGITEYLTGDNAADTLDKYAAECHTGYTPSRTQRLLYKEAFLSRFTLLARRFIASRKP